MKNELFEAIGNLLLLVATLWACVREWWFKEYFDRRRRRKEVLAKIAEGKSCTFDVLEVDLY